MISDMLRFFRIGFFLDCDCMKELDLDKPTDVLSFLGRERSLVLPVSSGPYSHVTSQSLSLLQKSANCTYSKSEG